METKKKAIIVDLDGTLCNNPHRLDFKAKSHKDYWPLYEHIPEDIPNEWCVELIRMIELWGTQIIFLTARPDWARNMTLSWLETYSGLAPFNYRLIMMPNDWEGDITDFKESIITEIFKKFEISFAIDDNMDIVKMYESHGIKCLWCGNET
jgi:predicted secreted acid phosphatase